MDKQTILDYYDKYLSYTGDGVFVWKDKNTKSRVKIGAIAGYIDPKGYRRIFLSFKGMKYGLLIHRLVFLVEYGYLPEFIDHVNGNTLDNRKENLRETTKLQNSWNQKLRKTNQSGFKGVHFYKKDSNFQAYIRINGKKKHLGYFDKAENAAMAYDKAAKECFGDFAKTNF